MRNMKRAALYLSLCTVYALQSAPPVAVPVPVQIEQIQINKEKLRAQPQIVRPVPAPFLRPARRVPIRPTTQPRVGLPTRKQIEAVTLINDDTFAGQFIGFDPKKGLLWDHPFMQPKPITIDPTKIKRVTFAPKSLPGDARRGSTRVSLANGDELLGELQGLDQDALTLKTWYGGQISLKRDALKRLIPGQKTQDALYQGPNAKDKWTHSNSYGAVAFPQGIALPPERLAQLKARGAARWAFKDDALQSNGTGAQAGLDFGADLPDLANIEFDLEWTSSPSVYLSLYTDNLKSYTQGNSYSVRISSTSVYIYRYNQGRGNRLGDTARYTAQTQPGAPAGARFSLRVNKEKKTILLYVNNRYVQKWVDHADFAGKGRGLMFRAGTANPMRLSNLRISPWDGVIPGKTENAVADGKSDSVRLANNDTLKGTLKSIQDGALDFTYYEANMQIQLGKISTIHFRQPAQAPAAPSKAVRLTLKNRGRLTCTLKEWKDGKVRVAAPSLGEATLDAKIIEAIDFNPSAANTTAAPPKPAAGTTRLNINGINIPQQLIEQQGGRLNIQGGRIEILPAKKGIRIERKLQIRPRAPQPKKR